MVSENKQFYCFCGKIGCPLCSEHTRFHLFICVFSLLICRFEKVMERNQLEKDILIKESIVTIRLMRDKFDLCARS